MKTTIEFEDVDIYEGAKFAVGHFRAYVVGSYNDGVGNGDKVCLVNMATWNMLKFEIPGDYNGRTILKSRIAKKLTEWKATPWKQT